MRRRKGPGQVRTTAFNIALRALRRAGCLGEGRVDQFQQVIQPGTCIPFQVQPHDTPAVLSQRLQITERLRLEPMDPRHTEAVEGLFVADPALSAYLQTDATQPAQAHALVSGWLAHRSAGLGHWLLRTGWARRLVERLTRSGKVVKTTSATGFLLLYGVASLKRYRRGSLRWRRPRLGSRTRRR